MGEFLVCEIEGFNVYVPDYISIRDRINSSGWITMTNDPHELVESLIQTMEDILKKHKDKLMKMGVKHIAVLSLGQYYYARTKAPAIPLGSHVMLLFKRKPKLVEEVRPYP